MGIFPSYLENPIPNSLAITKTEVFLHSPKVNMLVLCTHDRSRYITHAVGAPPIPFRLQ